MKILYKLLVNGYAKIKKQYMQEALGLTNKFNWKNCAPFGNCTFLSGEDTTAFGVM